MDIGSRLRYLRERAGYDLRRLSRETKIRLELLEQVEANEAIPSIQDLARIGEVLGFDPAEPLRQRADGVHKADGSIDASGGPGDLEEYHRFSLCGKWHFKKPVLNKVQCGKFLQSTDLDYPPGVADDYAWVQTDDPNAFCVVAAGDSMRGGEGEESIKEGERLLLVTA